MVYEGVGFKIARFKIMTYYNLLSVVYSSIKYYCYQLPCGCCLSKTQWVGRHQAGPRQALQAGPGRYRQINDGNVLSPPLQIKILPNTAAGSNVSEQDNYLSETINKPRPRAQLCTSSYVFSILSPCLCFPACYNCTQSRIQIHHLCVAQNAEIMLNPSTRPVQTHPYSNTRLTGAWHH